MVISTLFHLLNKVGINASFYYVVLESLPDAAGQNLKSDLKPVECGFLTLPQVDKLYSHPEIKGLDGEMHKWRNDGCRCFAIKYRDEYISYAWCNMSRLSSDFFSYPLREDEAYIFRARTLGAYRGHNLAPFLRLELYKILVQMNRSKFYSITEYFNTPARKLKKKLGARNIRLCFYVGILNRRLCNITLKKYPQAD
jgi:hypothetical protein